MTIRNKPFEKNFEQFQKDFGKYVDTNPIVPFITHSKKKDLFNNPLFWKSEFPKNYLTLIYNSELKIPFILGYLSENVFFNEDISNEFFNYDSQLLLKLFKFSKSFLHENHSSWLIKTQPSFAPELDAIRQSVYFIQEQRKELISKIVKHDIATVILSFLIALEVVKENSMGSFSKQAQQEMALFGLFSEVLLEYKNLPFNFEPNSSEELFQLERTNRQSIGNIIEILNDLIHIESESNKIDFYSTGLIDVKEVQENKVQFEFTDEHPKFLLNDRKKGPEEFYTTSISFESTTPEKWLNRQINGTEEIEYFKFYNYPTSVIVNDFGVDLHKVWKLIKYFSVFKGLSAEKDFPATEVFNEFNKIFGAREPISIFNKTIFIERVSGFFGWSENETIQLVDFISFNPTVKDNKEWFYNPLIVLDDKIIWMGSFMTNRKFSALTFNKLKTESESKTINLISNHFEVKCADLFRKAGYKTSSGVKFVNPSNKKRGDIDLLAYKNGELVLGEIKLGNISDDFHHSSYTELVKLEGLAAEQLDKILEYVHEDWDNLKYNVGIETNKGIDQINITPLIITNHFEGDLKYYKSHSKLSLLELDVILNNGMNKLYRDYFLTDSLRNINKRDKLKYIQKNYDLWKGKKRYNHDILLRNLKENTLWEPLRQYWLD